MPKNTKLSHQTYALGMAYRSGRGVIKTLYPFFKGESWEKKQKGVKIKIVKGFITIWWEEKGKLCGQNNLFLWKTFFYLNEQF